MCYNHPAHVQIQTNEVNMIRKFLSLFFMAVIAACLFCLVPEAGAASQDSKVGAVTTSSGNLNVRSQPSSGASVVASLGKGSYVTLLSRSGSWWKVEYAKGKTGYCHGDYITVVQGSPVTVATQSGSLNVRSGPGNSYEKAASLSKGETVLQLSSSNGWSRVLYHGTKTGYVSTQYLSGGYSAVSLNVPCFRQMDGRWSDTLIGSSGKTFAQIGCATTAVAMMESFRTGTVIYPDAMAKQLTYTPSGNLYWPSHYRSVTDGSGYLSAVYELLRQGKPVLLGARNASGGQHWVVVTGYQGGSGLSASGFTIHDPGTASRTNLQQLLNVYPNFYKFFHY